MSPDDYTVDEILEARAPIASLLSKSEKAQLKVAPGSWQHTMLGDSIKALRVATPLIGEVSGVSDEPTHDELEDAIRALDSMIERVAQADRIENSKSREATGFTRSEATARVSSRFPSNSGDQSPESWLNAKRARPPTDAFPTCRR